MNKYRTRDETPQPFTDEERLNIQLGKSFFWWNLETIFIKSFEGLTFTNPKGQKEPFEFSSIHREWAVLAQFNPRMCLQAPRAHLKTTVIGQGGPFWQMFKADQNELVDGIYFSYKAELANEKVAALKRLIQVNPYCRFWRDLKPTSENIIDYLVDWGDGPIAEVTLKGSGIKGATRGRHPKFVICLTPDTLVRTKRGFIPIEEVVVDDEVLTHKSRWRTVMEVMSRQVAESLINLKLDNKTGVRLTHNHRILTKRGWIKARELIVGDVLLRFIEREMTVQNGTKILEIEGVYYEGQVYNLEVDEDHSYGGKGIIYHNCDDILSDFSNPLQSSELRLINRIFRQTIMSLPANPDDVLWLIGTPQAYDDILYQLATNEEWLWLIYPAIRDWVKQTTQWPEKFDFERLMRIQKNVGPTAFEVEYMLTPITVTDQFLTREDVLLAVDDRLKSWPVNKDFVNLDRLGTYGGLDIGKLVHPSHVSIFLEMPSGTLIQLFQRFLDGTNYVQQVKILNALAVKFQLTRGYYDNTRNELDDRGLNKRWRGRTFTAKLKADIAVKLEKRVFAEKDDKGILLLGDDRQIRSIVQVRKDLKADEGPDGHGDAFWSNALAVKAADDGPVLVDIGSADPRFNAMKNQRRDNPRDTIWRQLGGNQ